MILLCLALYQLGDSNTRKENMNYRLSVIWRIEDDFCNVYAAATDGPKTAQQQQAYTKKNIASKSTEVSH